MKKNAPPTVAPELSDLLPVREAAQLLPIPTHHSTILRWIRVGIWVGERNVRLTAFRAGKRALVRMIDVREFMKRAGAATPPHAPRADRPPLATTPRKRAELDEHSSSRRAS